MNLLEDDSTVMGKTRDLCETIANDSDYRDLLQKVDFGVPQAKLVLTRYPHLGKAKEDRT